MIFGKSMTLAALRLVVLPSVEIVSGQNPACRMRSDSPPPGGEYGGKDIPGLVDDGVRWRREHVGHNIPGFKLVDQHGKR